MDLPLVESLAARLRRRSVVRRRRRRRRSPRPGSSSDRVQQRSRPSSSSAMSLQRPVSRPSTSSSTQSGSSVALSSKPSPKVRPSPAALYGRAITHIPTEHTVGNTVRKVLHHMREEYHTAIKSTAPASRQDGFSISRFVLQGQPRHHSAQKSDPDKLEHTNATDQDHTLSEAEALKPVLLEAIQDVLDELETVYDNVSKNAKDHIHAESAPSCTLPPSPH